MSGFWSWDGRNVDPTQPDVSLIVAVRRSFSKGIGGGVSEDWSDRRWLRPSAMHVVAPVGHSRATLRFATFARVRQRTANGACAIALGTIGEG